MKRSVKALLIMVSFLLVAGHSNARLLKKNNLLITPDSLSAVDDSLNSLVDDDTRLQTADGHMEKNAVRCVQQILNRRSGSSSEGATKKKSLSFRLSPGVQNIDKMESSASSNKAQGVYMVTEQRLSTSSNSPGIGHMQMIRHNFHSRNANNMKSHHGNDDDHVQQKKSNKRKLGSTPSPGGGH